MLFLSFFTPGSVVTLETGAKNRAAVKSLLDQAKEWPISRFFENVDTTDKKEISLGQENVSIYPFILLYFII